MKILIAGDIHISKYSSLIQSRGNVYSTRLENCIQSINWFEDLAKKLNCDLEVFLGDTFHSSELDDETVTAVKTINWNNLDHYFLCGNHESSVDGLRFNSVNMLRDKNKFIIDSVKSLDFANIRLHFLPYITEINRKPLIETLELDKQKRNFVFSHNDLKGIRMGQFISKEGFDVSEIDNNVTYYFNGHLHNGAKISNKIINVGILTGMGFGEDAFKYPHNVYLLDTDTLQITSYENPYAFNFYNIKINSLLDLDRYLNNKIKNNAVLSVKVLNKKLDANTTLVSKVEQRLSELSDKVVASRFLEDDLHVENNEIINNSDAFVLDYVEEFKNFMAAKLGTNEEILQEINMICS